MGIKNDGFDGVSEKAFMCGLENFRGTFVTGRLNWLSFTSAETEEFINWKELLWSPTDQQTVYYRYNCSQSNIKKKSKKTWVVLKLPSQDHWLYMRRWMTAELPSQKLNDFVLFLTSGCSVGHKSCVSNLGKGIFYFSENIWPADWLENVTACSV